MAARWSVFYGNLINLNTRLARHDICEGGIVDAILIFINEDPGVRRSHNAAQLVVCFVSGSRKPITFPKRLAHGITADLEIIADYMIWETLDGMVSGTMINTDIIHISVYLSRHQRLRVGVVLSKGRTHVSTAPIGARNDNRSGIIAVGIQIRSPVVIVTRINDPAQRQLLCAVHAVNCPGFLLCLAQDWQQHGRKNCNNGNDHQQFN